MAAGTGPARMRLAPYDAGLPNLGLQTPDTHSERLRTYVERVAAAGLCPTLRFVALHVNPQSGHHASYSGDTILLFDTGLDGEERVRARERFAIALLRDAVVVHALRRLFFFDAQATDAQAAMDVAGELLAERLRIFDEAGRVQHSVARDELRACAGRSQRVTEGRTKRTERLEKEGGRRWRCRVPPSSSFSFSFTLSFLSSA